jgi:histone deacetylase complex regulatory component SIN3
MKTKISQNCDNALAYVKAVEVTFKDKNETRKFDEFLKIIIDLNLRKDGKRRIATRVKKLFEGNSDLLFGFNTFLLPEEYQITLPSSTG